MSTPRRLDQLENEKLGDMSKEEQRLVVDRACDRLQVELDANAPGIFRSSSARAAAIEAILATTPTSTPLYGESEFDEEHGPFKCTTCGNVERFLGIDHHGYGGRDSCESAECEVEGECNCETKLTQPFTVDDGEVSEYGLFEGGGYGAEIGAYTEVRCAHCGQVLWRDASIGADQ